MRLFTHKDFPFIQENVAIVYRNFDEHKSVFGWIMFNPDSTFAGSMVVEHPSTPTEEAIKESLGGLAYELEQQKSLLEGKEGKNGRPTKGKSN